jgi:UPF0716 protein FxsA
MVILGGAFLITPGFITDVIGLLLLIPPTRAVFRGMVARMARRRTAFAVRTVHWGSRPPDRGYPPGEAARDYDYEGTAREVREVEGELHRRSGDGKP